MFRMIQFSIDPPYTVFVLHIRMLQMTMQELSATRFWSLDFSRFSSYHYSFCNGIHVGLSHMYSVIITERVFLGYVEFAFSVIGCWHATRSRTTGLASWSATSLKADQSTPCTAASRTSKTANLIQIVATFMTTTYHCAVVSRVSPATCFSVRIQ